MSSSNTPVEPIEAYEEVYVDMPQWPKAVGIISIIWGSLGLSCLGCGLLGIAMQAYMVSEEMRANSPPTHFGPIEMAAMGLGGFNSALLLVAGVLTIRRSIAGRYLHLVHALAAMPLVAMGMWMTSKQQAEQAQWLAQHPDSPAAKFMGGAGGGAIKVFTLVLQIGLGLGYPLFLLVWFGIVKRTHASMTGQLDEDLTPPVS